MARSMIARSDGIVYDSRSAYEADLGLNILALNFLLLALPSASPLALYCFGIFSRADTKAATAAKAGRRRERWIGLDY